MRCRSRTCAGYTSRAQRNGEAATRTTRREHRVSLHSKPGVCRFAERAGGGRACIHGPDSLPAHLASIRPWQAGWDFFFPRPLDSDALLTACGRAALARSRIGVCVCVCVCVCVWQREGFWLETRKVERVLVSVSSCVTRVAGCLAAWLAHAGRRNPNNRVVPMGFKSGRTDASLWWPARMRRQLRPRRHSQQQSRPCAAAQRRRGSSGRRARFESGAPICHRIPPSSSSPRSFPSHHHLALGLPANLFPLLRFSFFFCFSYIFLQDGVDLRRRGGGDPAKHQERHARASARVDPGQVTHLDRARAGGCRDHLPRRHLWWP